MRIIKKLVAVSSIASLLMPNFCWAFSVDFAPGTPLVEALRALGFKANKNVIIDGDLNGTVSLHMENTTFEKAIKLLSLAKGFNYEEQGDTVLIGTQKNMNSVETFKLSHSDPELVAKQMAVLVEDEKKVVVNKNKHSITVLGSSNVLDRIKNQLKQIDVAAHQVSIRAEVIEIDHGKGRDMGLSFTSNPWTKDTSVGTNEGFVFSVLGKHEETRTKGKVLARPSVTTFDGNKATILMGDKVPVFTSTQSTTGSSTNNSATVTVEYKDVGVKLEVEPYINDLQKGIVSMAIKPAVSTISEWIESGNNKAPQISERSAETVVRVKSGETILIGGLLKDEEIKSLKAVPFLSKIPILGELFKSRSFTRKHSELVIAITPTILKDDATGRPEVEKQRTTPQLREAMNNLKGENSEYNKQNKDKSLNLEENARLKKELAKYKKELQQNNYVMKQIIKDAQRRKANNG